MSVLDMYTVCSPTSAPLTSSAQSPLIGNSLLTGWCGSCL